MSHASYLSAPARLRWLETLVIVSFWAAIFLLSIGKRAVDPWGPPGLAWPEVAHAAAEYSLWLVLTPAIFWLSSRYAPERGGLARPLLMHVGVALAVAVLVDAVSTFVFYELGMMRGNRTFSFGRGVAGLHFLDELIIYLVVLAAGFARSFFYRSRAHLRETVRLRTEAAQLQARLAEARLEALRMQINPHFLFNTLHAVASLVERDPRGVRRMLARLSELLRYTLDHPHTQEVPLHEELQFVRGYLEIQQIRFQGRLEVQESVAPDTLDALVPALALQPLVENAIKHGGSQVEGVGVIALHAWRAGDELHLSVRDNGPGPAQGDGASATGHAGVGLRNTRARLAGLYGADAHLDLAVAAGGGADAHLVLPYHTAPVAAPTSASA